MEHVVLLRRLLVDEMNKWVSGEKMSAKWQALAFHVVEGSAAMLEMLEADALADLEAIGRGEWDEPSRFCRREAYRHAPHVLPRSGK